MTLQRSEVMDILTGLRTGAILRLVFNPDADVQRISTGLVAAQAGREISMDSWYNQAVHGMYWYRWIDLSDQTVYVTLGEERNNRSLAYFLSVDTGLESIDVVDSIPEHSLDAIVHVNCMCEQCEHTAIAMTRLAVELMHRSFLLPIASGHQLPSDLKFVVGSEGFGLYEMVR